MPVIKDKNAKTSSMGFQLERRELVKKVSLKRHNKKINKSIEGWSS